MSGDEPPETGKRRRVEGVARRDAIPAVSAAIQGQDGAWTRLDDIVDAPREVDAEKREARIGYGVDQRLHQLRPLGHEREVVAAERHDRHVGIETRESSEPIR